MNCRTVVLIIIAVVAAVVLLLGFLAVLGLAAIQKAWAYILSDWENRDR